MIAIKVPPLGESIVEATISRWLKNEGEAVAAGETLVELETDKITVEVPALQGGVLVKRAHAEGDVVKVDDLLAELDETQAGAAPAAAPKQPSAQEASGDGAGGSGDTATQPPATAQEPGTVQGGRASPAAQRLATEQKVDLSGVAGTGRGGVVSKADVVEHVSRGGQPQQSATAASSGAPAAGGAKQPAAPPRSAPRSAAAAERETREKMTTRRRRIAENLLESQHATAHLTTFNEIDMSVVEAFRGRMKERVEKEHGVRLSVMPFFIKAACLALEAYPTVNAQIDGDSVVYKHYVNMGIAVASDAGLVVPNIKDADAMSVIEIGRELSAVAKRARDGKLAMDDLMGGTFTITNGGVFGSLVSTPIINYPQVGILGLHKIQERPVAVEGQVVIRPMMYIALSYDHRLIDGQQAVLFLVRVKELMEEPASMLLG